MNLLLLQTDDCLLLQPGVDCLLLQDSGAGVLPEVEEESSTGGWGQRFRQEQKRFQDDDAAIKIITEFLKRV